MIFFTKKSRIKFFICDAIIFWGIIFSSVASYAQNAKSVSNNTNAENNNPINRDQRQISQLIYEMARQNKIAGGDLKRKANLTFEELAKNRKINELMRLQTSSNKLQTSNNKPQTPREKKEIEQNKKFQEFFVKIRPEINEIFRKNAEQKKADIQQTLEKNRQERQNEIDRQNDENRRLMNKYFKDALKNLPQKGQHKNYSAYHKSFRPELRKALADYSGYNSSFQTTASKGQTNYDEYNSSFQAIQRKGQADYNAYNKTFQPIAKK